MKQIYFIARREMQSYLNSPVAYIVLVVFLLLLGYFYFSTLFIVGIASLRNFFSIAPLLLVIFGPALSMRLIAEERKSGTIEPLLCLPVKDSEVVIGKFLGCLGVIVTGLIFTFPYVFTLAWLTPEDMYLDFGPIIGGYLGLVFLASSFIALGLLASSLTKNQIVAFIVGFGFCLFFFLIDKLALLLPSQWSEIFAYLSVDVHFNNVARGIIDSRDIIYYLSLTVVALFLTTFLLRQSKD